MKILVVSDNEYGCGASIIARTLAGAFSERGNEVVYVFRNKHNGKIPMGDFKEVLLTKGSKFGIAFRSFIFQLLHFFFAALAKITPGSNLKNYLVHLRRLFKYKNNVLLYQHRLYQQAAAFDPDVIHLHDVLTFLEYSFIHQLSQNCKVVWTFHNRFPVNGFTTQYKNLNDEIIESYPDLTFDEIDVAGKNRLFEKSDIKYVTPSRWLYDIVLPYVNNNNSIKVIHNGLSKSTFSPIPKEDARKQLNLSPNRKYALAIVGKLHLEHKNFQFLYDCFRENVSSEVELLVIGNKGKWKHPLPNNITYLGAIYDNEMKNKYLCAADIFVIPSLADNFPTVVLESLFCGTPVLGAKIGGIPEMVVDDETGYLFDPYNQSDFVNKLDSILTDKEKLHILEKKCRSYATEHFTLQHCVDKYLKLFDPLKYNEV